MKTFKEYLSETYSSGGMPRFQQQWQDQDTMPSAAEAIEALNSLVGQIGEQECMNPKLAVQRLKENLSRLGYEFDMGELDPSGTTTFPLRYGNGTFHANYEENPYGEYKESDGISDHIEGGISLMVTSVPSGNGKSMVDAEIVRNLDNDTSAEY